jgi:DNA-binding GntR family transcriptional regulator
MDNLITSDKFFPQSKEDFAYESIKEAILSGQLAPNQQISLTALAKNLGVSIIPVNHAIRRLITEGLVRQDPHHSPYVEEFSAEALKNILDIRYHLEELAMRDAITHIGPAELKVLRQMKADMDLIVQEKDMHKFGIANRDFHMMIYSYSENKLLYDLIDDLWNKAELNRSRSVFSLVQNMAEQSQQHHGRLLDLIEQGKIEDTIQMLHEHRSFSRNKLLGYS